MTAGIDLFIIGAQKAGTTSLKNYLAEHPEIVSHPQNEFGFLTDEATFAAGFEKTFKECFTLGNTQNPRIKIAKNANASLKDFSMERAFQINPQAKIIFIIREPVSRLSSAYHMEKFNGWLDRNFEEFQDVINKNDQKDMLYRLFLYMGLYAEQLEIVYKYFPREQVKIIFFEDLKGKPALVCRDIFNWLSINPDFTPNFEVIHNETKQAKSKSFSQLILWLRNNKNPLKKLAKILLPYSLFSFIGKKIIEANKSQSKPKTEDQTTKEILKHFYQIPNQNLEKIAGIELPKNWYK
jgi:hypothetical protein